MRAWHLPKRFRHEPSWHHIAAAFVVRMGDTVESILTLWEADRRSGLDMMILLRALYEQTIVFAWLAIDPDTHLEEWGKAERHFFRAGVAEAAEYGIPTSEEDLSAKGVRPKSLDQLARLVDELGWAADRLPRGCGEAAGGGDRPAHARGPLPADLSRGQLLDARDAGRAGALHRHGREAPRRQRGFRREFADLVVGDLCRSTRKRLSSVTT